MQQPQIEPSPTSAAAELYYVPVEQVDAAWPEIASYLAKVERPQWGLDDVYCDLKRGESVVIGWRGHGVWICRVEQNLTHKYGVVWICAGDGLEEGLKLFREHVERWFWDHGCEWIELTGRRGWKRAMPDYAEAEVVLRKYRGQ